MWTDDRVESLKSLWAQGLSAAIIADRLGGGVTRNAVLGKVHRIGCSGRAVMLRKNPYNQQGVKRICKAREKASRPPSWLESLPKVPLPKEDIPAGPLVAFADLEDHHCRHVYGDVKAGDWGYCGQDRVTGRSYCAAHCQRHYQPVEVRKPRPFGSALGAEEIVCRGQTRAASAKEFA